MRGAAWRIPLHVAARVGRASLLVGAALLAVAASVDVAGQLRALVEPGGGALTGLGEATLARLGVVALGAAPVGAAAVFATLETSGERVALEAVGGRSLGAALAAAALAAAVGTALALAGQGPLPGAEARPGLVVRLPAGILPAGILAADGLDRAAGILTRPQWLGLGPDGRITSRWAASRAVWTGGAWVARGGRLWREGEEDDRPFASLTASPSVPGPEAIAPDPRGWMSPEAEARLTSLGWDLRPARRAGILGASLPLLLGGLTLLGAGLGRALGATLAAGLGATGAALLVLAGCVWAAASPSSPLLGLGLLIGAPLGAASWMWLKMEGFLKTSAPP